MIPKVAVCSCSITWAQDVNWMYMKRGEHVLDVFWTCYRLSIYVLWPGRIKKLFRKFRKTKRKTSVTGSSGEFLKVFKNISLAAAPEVICYRRHFSNDPSTTFCSSNSFEHVTLRQFLHCLVRKIPISQKNFNPNRKLPK